MSTSTVPAINERDLERGLDISLRSTTLPDPLDPAIIHDDPQVEISHNALPIPVDGSLQSSTSRQVNDAPGQTLNDSINERALQRWRQDARFRPSKPGYDKDGLPLKFPGPDSVNGRAMRQWRRDAILHPDSPGYDKHGFPIDLPGSASINGRALRQWWRDGVEADSPAGHRQVPGYHRNGFPLALRDLMMPSDGDSNPNHQERVPYNILRPNWPGYDGAGLPLWLPDLSDDTGLGWSSSDSESRSLGEDRKRGASRYTGPISPVSTSPALPKGAESLAPEQKHTSTLPTFENIRQNFDNIVEPQSHYERIFNLEEAREFSRDGFEQSLKRYYESNLIYHKRNTWTVNLATLQRINLQRLQRDLVREAFRFQFENAGNRPDLDFKIHRYVKALRDWDYAKQCALKGEEKDPFVVTTEKPIDFYLFQEVVEMLRAELKLPSLVSKLEEDLKKFGKLAEPQGKVVLFGGPRNVLNKKEAFQSFLRRSGMACIGGAFLIGPMLLMVLHKSLLTSLLTSSICVFAFGLIMAMFLEDSFDVLSATAAYAAVLVVFVGTSGGD